MREALEKCAAALQTLPKSEKDIIKFTKEWARFGSMSVASILDEANAALSQPDPQPSEPKDEPVAWMFEDELPPSYPYDKMFEHSEVRGGVRVFPVYTRPALDREKVALPGDGWRPITNRKGIQSWEVSVAVNGENVITIGHNHLAGVEMTPELETAIEMAAHHLLSFLGKSCSICGGDDTATTNDGWRPIESAPHGQRVLLGWRDWRDHTWCMEVGLWYGAVGYVGGD